MTYIDDSTQKHIDELVRLLNKVRKENHLLKKVNKEQAKQLFLFGVSNSLPTDDYWETRCKLMEQVEENNPCDPDINQGQIDAWSKYHNFIKERGQRQ